jgi:hypothetical protein
MPPLCPSDRQSTPKLVADAIQFSDLSADSTGCPQCTSPALYDLAVGGFTTHPTY